MKKKISKYIYFALCFILFISSALYFSDLLMENLLNGMNYSNEIFSLNYVENTGAAFSILKDSREILIIVSVVAICAIVSYFIRHTKDLSMIEIFFMAMLSAGIGGNLHERIAYGFVRDYFQLSFINFPIFNISDIMINIGVAAIILLLLKKKL